MKITDIIGRQILDSRGNPTVEADVILDDEAFGRASVPSGTSTGSHEAHELRDGGSAYNGKGVRTAVAHINEELQRALVGQEADQAAIDRLMIKLDGTPTKERLGANAILAVSLALAHARAAAGHDDGEPVPLYDELGDHPARFALPLPMMNIINGGQHAKSSTDIQEFMILPVGAPTFAEAVRMGAEVFHTLHDVLDAKGYATTVGDEGGYAPHVNGNAEALDLIMEAIGQAGYRAGKDIVLAVDVAASEFYRNGRYELATEKKILTSQEMVNWYQELLRKYPIVSIEDGLSEDDWAGWQLLTKTLGAQVQLVGDDLFVTNVARLKQGIAQGVANAILIKPNQIGTLTETRDAIRVAHAADYKTIMSHRSGETEDVTIAHLAVGLTTYQIKTGSLSRSERIAKYNELMRIEEYEEDGAFYAGRRALTVTPSDYEFDQHK